MKFIKNFTIILSIIIICSIFDTKAAPTFEIFNKASGPIGLAVGRLKNITVHPGKGFQFATDDININKNHLAVMICPTIGSSCKTFTINAPGKTKYLTWDPTKKIPLYPQTGPLIGLLNKTESGWSLQNNLAASQIT